MKRILITGGCGFVGSNLAISIKKKYPKYQVICFDNLKRRGSELNILRLKNQGIEFVHGDIRSVDDLDVFKKIDVLIDASAEPSVTAGLDGNPNYLIQTNFNGTINCLNLALKHKAVFIFLSTSRVYPIEAIEKIAFRELSTRFKINKKQNIPGISSKGISESFPLDGYRSLYGATKLASELVITEYQKLMGLRTVINRCGVLTGPYQMGKVDQGVVVLWVARHFWQQNLKYFGYGGAGKQVRDILHIDDLFHLVDIQIHNIDKVNGQTYNVGGGLENSVSLKELTKICEQVTGNQIRIGAVPETRTADIRIYITDNTKVEKHLNWRPQITPYQVIEDVYQWIKANEAQLKPILA